MLIQLQGDIFVSWCLCKCRRSSNCINLKTRSLVEKFRALCGSLWNFPVQGCGSVIEIYLFNEDIVSLIQICQNCASKPNHPEALQHCIESTFLCKAHFLNSFAHVVDSVRKAAWENTQQAH